MNIKGWCIGLLLVLYHLVASASGEFFQITSSGVPIAAEVNLCLNGKGPASCQRHQVTGSVLTIHTTIPNHVYPNIGIKINTPGYILANQGIDCIVLANGYCLFSASDSVTKVLTILVQGADLSIEPSALPAAVQIMSYAQSLSASGGVAPYTYAISSGSLPPGLTLGVSGVLSGTPTTPGTYSFTVTVTDSNNQLNSGSRSYSIFVQDVTLSIAPVVLPDAVQIMSYTQSLTASGGVPPYTYVLSSGSLPPGLTLSASGDLSGTPTTPGTYSFTVTATDFNASPITGSGSYSISVQGVTLSITPSDLPAAVQNTSYTQSLTASGGVSPYTYAVSSGSLPPGLTLSASGNLSGTPTTVGTYSFTVTATDSNNPHITGSQSYSILVQLPITPSTLASAVQNIGYTQSFTASGGVSPYTYTISSGSLPQGFALNASGVLSGTTSTTPGSYTFTVTATDSSSPSNTGSISYSIDVIAPTIAYVASNDGHVYQCSLNLDGSFNTCSITPSSGAPAWGPLGIAFATVNGKQYAYVSDNSASHVYQCNVSVPDGGLNSCTITSVSADPHGVTFGAVNGLLYSYVADYNGNVFQCTLNPNGSYNLCTAVPTPSPAWSNGPFEVAFATLNGTQYAYVADNAVGVYRCDINIDGSFSSCATTPSSPPWGQPYGITIAEVNGSLYAYVQDSGGAVYQCIFDSSTGNFNSCSGTPSSSPPWSRPYGSAFASFSGIQYAYVADMNNGMHQCTLNSNGSFNSCSTTPSSPPSGWSPADVAFLTPS